ncbi:RraA family protein [Enterocloster lavalensis]|uniref:RraA family protein n=1 Tax=Enterocloster lavalensis TaxID=460384 RepID=UPI001D06CBF4|nr:RraA family protein [Enterocloster lavalensis]MCB6343827.1 RraA family protein [Enterocloster lavalensis]
MRILEKERELFERLREFTVPELCDGAGVFSAMDYHIKPWIGRTKIVGRALTVKVPAGEGAIVSRAIELAGDGDVIVIAGQGICQCSYWGDHRSLCARLQGAAGVVIDGAFRDLEGCEEAGFPVFARALTCGTAQKTGEGQINVPVSCAGVAVNPGDFIVGDVNGVCVIPRDQAETVLERAAKKVAAQKRAAEEMERTGKAVTRIQMDR